MTLIRAAFFDLDETLIQDTASMLSAIERCVPAVQEELPNESAESIAVRFRDVNTWHWENYDESPIGSMMEPLQVRSFIWGKVMESYGIQDEGLALRLAELFQIARFESYCCYEDTIEVLQAIQCRMPLVLITNGNSQMQRSKIKRCGLEPYFDQIVIAQEVGASKPRPPIFEEALAFAGVPAENVLMVGDNWHKDIEGGMRMGMKTAWIQRRERKPVPGDTHPDWIVETLAPIRDLLERTNA